MNKTESVASLYWQSEAKKERETTRRLWERAEHLEHELSVTQAQLSAEKAKTRIWGSLT